MYLIFQGMQGFSSDTSYWWQVCLWTSQEQLHAIIRCLINPEKWLEDIRAWPCSSFFLELNSSDWILWERGTVRSYPCVHQLAPSLALFLARCSGMNEWMNSKILNMSCRGRFSSEFVPEDTAPRDAVVFYVPSRFFMDSRLNVYRFLIYFMIPTARHNRCLRSGSL
jgi:hypothetical protein